jgi:hypothetical protein
MLPALTVFVLVVGGIMGIYAAMMRVPGMLAARRLESRLLDISMPATTTDAPSTDETVVKHTRKGPVPALDRLLAQSAMGSRLAPFDQSGVRTTQAPSSSWVWSGRRSFLVSLFVPCVRGPARRISSPRRHSALAPPVRQAEALRRAVSKRSIRRPRDPATCVQTALGMAGRPIRLAEFKKTFDQQNYGLPLRDALNEMAAASRFRRALLRDRRAHPAGYRRQPPRSSTTSRTSCASDSKSSARSACTPRTAGSPVGCCSRCRRRSPLR